MQRLAGLVQFELEGGRVDIDGYVDAAAVVRARDPVTFVHDLLTQNAPDNEDFQLVVADSDRDLSRRKLVHGDLSAKLAVEEVLEE